MRKLLLVSTMVMSVGLLGAAVPVAHAQTPAAAAANAAAPEVWKYKTPKLNKAQLDALFAKPEKLVVIDVRRPDELTNIGQFPVFLSIQFQDLANQLAYIPKDRKIVTVSNRAHRAGDAGDFLTAHGFKVIGAAGTKDYEEQGGSVLHIAPPPPKTAAQ